MCSAENVSHGATCGRRDTVLTELGNHPVASFKGISALHPRALAEKMGRKKESMSKWRAQLLQVSWLDLYILNVVKAYKNDGLSPSGRWVVDSRANR
jgi:hypothetical protein